MTEKEKATGILRHYFKLKHDISNFEVLDIQNRMIDISLVVTDSAFADPYIDIHFVDFKQRAITGTIDISLAEMYVNGKVDEVELSE